MSAPPHVASSHWEGEARNSIFRFHFLTWFSVAAVHVETSVWELEGGRWGEAIISWRHPQAHELHRLWKAAEIRDYLLQCWLFKGLLESLRFTEASRRHLENYIINGSFLDFASQAFPTSCKPAVPWIKTPYLEYTNNFCFPGWIIPNINT